VVLPAAALAVVVTMHAAASSVEASLPASHAAAMWRGVVVMTASWLAYAIVLAALQPRRDERAAARVQDMRVRAGLPDHALLCILGTIWTSPAGQRVAAVDVRTGAVREVWLAESGLASGTYTLVSFRRGVAVMLDSATPTTVIHAKRHQQRVDPRQRATRRSPTTTRREGRAAAAVVHEAEALLRHS
jgi:hypothetical protein